MLGGGSDALLLLFHVPRGTRNLSPKYNACGQQQALLLVPYLNLLG